MKIYPPDELKHILAEHAKWLTDTATGSRADLSYTDLSGANLYGANLSHANLSRANLSYTDLSYTNLTGASLTGANLSRANLSGANLSYTNLSGANLSCTDLSYTNLSYTNLSGADLSRANLSRANLSGASLTGANLSRANLSRANLSAASLTGASLTGAKLPPLLIVPEEGSFTGYKKTAEGAILTLRISKHAQRTNSTGRKCRASRVKVIASSHPGEVFTSTHDGTFTYRVGQIVEVADFDPDIRVECTRGIHFFLTRKEAEDYS